MPTFGIVAFRFGAPASEVIEAPQMQFYNALASSIAAKELSLPVHFQKSTLAVSLAELDADESITYSKFAQFTRPWVGTVEVIIVDIIDPRNTVRPGKPELHLASAIHAVLADRAGPHQPIFIILIPQLPPESEAFRTALQHDIDEGHVVIIDDDGRHVGRAPGLTAFDAHEYKLDRARALLDPLELLRAKMIRRLGHFRRSYPDGHSSCLRYFYDGSHCDRELAQLITGHVEQTYQDTPCPLLLYDSSLSEWLFEAAAAVANKLSLPSQDLDSFLRNPNVEFDADAAPPLFVLPLIDTGNALTGFLTRWLALYPLVTPNVFSILTTVLHDHYRGIRNVRIKGVQIPVRCLVEVSQRPTLPTACRLCALNIPFTDHDREDYQMITTYNMWEMVNKHGWKPEENVPGHRSGFAAVPKFPEIIQEHGAWIAHKLLGRLVYDLGKFPSETFLVIHPDQKGANDLARYLELLHDGITAVRIPDEVVKRYREQPQPDRPALDEIKWKASTWYLQVTSAAPTQPVIIMEEFSVSGRTKHALCKLVRDVGKDILCHLAMADFTPASTESDVRTLSLYSFPAQVNCKGPHNEKAEAVA